MLDDNFWPPTEAFLDLSSTNQLTDGQARCTGVAVCDEDGRAARTFQPGQRAHFFYEFEVLKEIGVPMAALECQDEGGRVFQVVSPNHQFGIDARERMILGSVLPGTWLYYHHIIHLKVGSGKYFFTVRLSLPDAGNPNHPNIGEQGNHLVHEYCRAIHAGSFTVVRELEQVVQTAPSPEEDVVWRHHINYQKLIQQIRGVVRTTLPLAATVIVISKGDDELLKLDGRRAWHFPQTEDGTYIGYSPANSTEAIAHLEVLRLKGGDFLLLPDTAFWWLAYYREFHQHLDAYYQRTWGDECCIIYQLSAL
jgi:hypothetical protein